MEQNERIGVWTNIVCQCQKRKHNYFGRSEPPPPSMFCHLPHDTRTRSSGVEVFLDGRHLTTDKIKNNATETTALCDRRPVTGGLVGTSRVRRHRRAAADRLAD